MQATMMDDRGGSRPVGALLAVSSALSVFVMAHHPSDFGNAALVGQAHGALIILLLIVYVGFIRFAVGRDLARLSVLAGLVAYSAGVVGNLLAATVNGFVVPEIVARGVAGDIPSFAWALNQALAYEAVYAISAAYVLWGLFLASHDRGANRIVGFVGVAAGAAPAALLALDIVNMHVAGAFIVYAAQAAFGVIVGIQMMREGR